MSAEAAYTEDDGAPAGPTCQWRPHPGSEPPPCWHGRTTDRDRMGFACATLARFGIVVAPAQEGPHDEVTLRLVAGIRSAFPVADGACAFWTAADEASCLGPDGSLRAPLAVHVHGPGVSRAAIAAFEQAGLSATAGPSHDVVLVSGDAAGAPVPSVAAADEPFVGVEIRIAATRSHVDAAEVRRRLEQTPLRLDRLDGLDGRDGRDGETRDGDSDGGKLRLVLVARDTAAPVTDRAVADVVHALADWIGWWSIIKLRRSDLAAVGDGPGQAP
jgi:hypothetical protein